VVLVLLGAAAAWVWTRATPGASADPLPFVVAAGEPLPTFRGYLLDPSGRGPLFTRDDTVGRPLILAAWSADDPETPAFLRALTNLAADDAHEQTTFLGINLDPDADAAVEALRATGAFTWPHLYHADPRLEVKARPATRLQISQTPALYHIDALGRFRHATRDPGELAHLATR
jgi:hypothetical protein